MSKRDYRSYGILNDEIIGEEKKTLENAVVDHSRDLRPLKGRNLKKEELNLIDHTTIDQDPIEQDPVDQDSVEQNPIEQDPVEQDPIQQDSIEQQNIGLSDIGEGHIIQAHIKKEKIKQKQDIPVNEEEIREVDTSFSYYKNQNPLSKKKGIVKWSIRLMKLAVFIMLLPLLVMTCAVVGGVILTIVAAIIVCIGTGIFILGAICFISSQVGSSLIALGIMAAITLLSLGSIFFILFRMLMKWIVGLIHKRRLKKNSQYKGGQ